MNLSLTRWLPWLTLGLMLSACDRAQPVTSSSSSPSHAVAFPTSGGACDDAAKARVDAWWAASAYEASAPPALASLPTLDAPGAPAVDAQSLPITSSGWLAHRALIQLDATTLRVAKREVALPALSPALDQLLTSQRSADAMMERPDSPPLIVLAADADLPMTRLRPVLEQLQARAPLQLVLLLRQPSLDAPASKAQPVPQALISQLRPKGDGPVALEAQRALSEQLERCPELDALAKELASLGMAARHDAVRARSGAAWRACACRADIGLLTAFWHDSLARARVTPIVLMLAEDGAPHAYTPQARWRDVAASLAPLHSTRVALQANPNPSPAAPSR